MINWPWLGHLKVQWGEGTVEGTTEPLTCGVGRYLQVDNIRTELIAWWCGKKGLHIRTGVRTVVRKSLPPLGWGVRCFPPLVRDASFFHLTVSDRCLSTSHGSLRLFIQPWSRDLEACRWQGQPHPPYPHSLQGSPLVHPGKEPNSELSSGQSCHRQAHERSGFTFTWKYLVVDGVGRKEGVFPFLVLSRLEQLCKRFLLGCMRSLWLVYYYYHCSWTTLF